MTIHDLDSLRHVAAHVADHLSDEGYAFVEDDQIDALAAVLGDFLAAADIPIGAGSERRP